MRSSWTWIGVVGALLVVASGAVAHLGSVDVEPEPETTDEALCVPVCEVDSNREAYVPGLVVVEDGGTVTWSSADGDPHTVTVNPAQDTPQIVAEGSSSFYPDACVDAEMQPGFPVEVSFAIREDGLHAKVTSSFGADWRACEAAQAVPGGGWLVTYHCQLHPRLQHGAILVLPG
jgi:plastocyanin